MAAFGMVVLTAEVFGEIELPNKNEVSLRQIDGLHSQHLAAFAGR